MASKQSKLGNSLRNAQDAVTRSHVLIRETTTQMLIIVESTKVSTCTVAKIRIGLEVTYRIEKRERGRGVVLLIGSEEQCATQLLNLEKKQEEPNGSTATIVNRNQKSTNAATSNENNIVSMIADDEHNDDTIATTDHENNSEIMPNDKSSASITATDENDDKSATTKNENGNGAIEPKNNRPTVAVDESNDDTTTTHKEKSNGAIVPNEQNNDPTSTTVEKNGNTSMTTSPKSKDATASKQKNNDRSITTDGSNDDTAVTHKQESNGATLPNEQNNDPTSTTGKKNDNISMKNTPKSKDATASKQKNNGRPITAADSDDDTIVTDNGKKKTASHSTITIGNPRNNVLGAGYTDMVIEELLKENPNSMSNTAIQTSAISDEISNPVGIPSKTVTSGGNLQRNLLSVKRLSTTSDELDDKKRSKIYDNDDTFSHARFLALQEENIILKREIDEMKATMILRPDPKTVDYFAFAVGVCDGENKYVVNADAKLKKLQKTLNLSKDELEECVDANSIRKTCRNVFRKVFKAELANPNIPYSKVLSNRQTMEAIRKFGRLKHQEESEKFSDGQLNKALGNDFYQRDHEIKLGKENKR